MKFTKFSYIFTLLGLFLLPRTSMCALNVKQGSEGLMYSFGVAVGVYYLFHIPFKQYLHNSVEQARIAYFGRTQQELDSELLCAARSGEEDDILRLVAQGANINAYSEFQTLSPLELLISENSPIYVAIRRGRIDIVKLILDLGAHINKKCLFITPLMQATRLADVEIVRLLLQRGASLEIENQEGCTAEHYVQEYARDIPWDRERKKVVRKLFFDHKKALIDQQLQDIALAREKILSQITESIEAVINAEAVDANKQQGGHEIAITQFDPSDIVQGYLMNGSALHE